MVPPPITEDFYMILEVDKTATTGLIAQSYKRLALKLHPDRNHHCNATAAFQLLGKAYETLKDETKRRDYDLIYPSIRQTQPSPQGTQTPRPPPTSGAQPGGSNEVAQIATILKSKHERRAQWWTKKNVFECSVFELHREIWRLEQEIKTLVGIAAAVGAEEAWSKSWGAWFLSPIYKQAQLTDEDKARKERQNQERRIETDMKERRLEVKKKDLEKQERLFKNGQGETDTADRTDDLRIRRLQDVIDARLAREREAREKTQREEMARIRKQKQEQFEKERAEAQKRHEEQQAADKKWREEQAKRAQHSSFDNDQDWPFFSAAGVCLHDDWWLKVQGRTSCPKCCEIWTYLLQCPGCQMKACPKCQAAMRPRRNRQPAPRRGRSGVDYDYFDF
ncbi:DnaJ domain-containing protein [Xylariaceae sp. AK1471]|nr:DnaJ domain-containing protein [Xylariaceae sp. AK1471]